MLEGLVICPKCQSENSSNATFCSKCGLKLGEEKSKKIYDNTVKNKKPVKKFQEKNDETFIQLQKILDESGVSLW